MDCPAEDVLGAYASGDLEPELAIDVGRHVADCSRCASGGGVAARAEPTAEEAGHDAADRIDRYHIRGVAGTGAIGVVHAAYDPKLDRKVALKVLRRAGPELEERLLREARAMARARSPNVVAVHDAG